LHKGIQMGANFLEIPQFPLPFSPRRWRQLNKTPGREGGKASGNLAPSARQRAQRSRGPNFLFLLVCACLRLHPSLVKQRRRRAAAEMEIRVRCGGGDSSCPEWAVVELQGVVQPQASFSGDIRGLHIGRLCSAPGPSSTKARHLVPIPWSSLGIWLPRLMGGGVGP